ncbi:MAG: hypothetical protein JO316_18640 [Abitibacteriaceae bacterium]|nr:hypothetical protein [Abditibacteriaceae bacterium]MBV9867380.1 hypothetical protein [Abditibacteriaceae bacterium]
MKTKKFDRLAGMPLPTLGLLSLVVGGGAAVQADEVPYTPSKYPGVMVRNVPQPATPKSAAPKIAAGAGMHKGWLYVKPGAAKPRFGAKYGTRGAGIWYEPGKTKAGGTIAHVDRSFYPYVTAKIVHPTQKGQKSKVALECIDGANAAHHETLQNGHPVTAKQVAHQRSQAHSSPTKIHQTKTQIRY